MNQKVDNSCLIRLMNNRHITVQEAAIVIKCSYIRSRKLMDTLKYDIMEAYDLANYLHIPIHDFCEILKGNKEILNKHLIPINT